VLKAWSCCLIAIPIPPAAATKQKQTQYAPK
jgi:hypothetical protein